MLGQFCRLRPEGYGFIRPEDGGKDVFFHARELLDIKFEDLTIDETIKFDIVSGEKSPLAVNIQKNLLEENYQEISNFDYIKPLYESFLNSLIRVVAFSPDQIKKIEWRQMEQIIHEAFSGLGFDTKLNPGGGLWPYDIEVNYSSNGKKVRILIEVKTWEKRRPGKKDIEKFLHVIVKESPDGGIFLSSNGFSKVVLENLCSIRKKSVELGSAKKLLVSADVT